MNALSAAQQGFAAVLNRMPVAKLSALPEDEEEVETLARAVRLWFLMVYSPVLNTTDAQGAAFRKFSLPLERLRADLAHQFSEARSDGLSVTLLDRVVVDDERGWVVVVDNSSVWEMDAAFIKVLCLIRAAMARSCTSKMLLLFMRSEAQYIFVVPILRGRAIARMGWKLFSTMLPPEPAPDSLPSPQMQCQPFDDPLWSQIGLPDWGGSLGEPMLQLLKDVREVHAFIRHVCEIARSPVDELGRQIRNEYWGEIWPDFVQLHRRVADSLTCALEETRGVDFLAEAMNHLAEMRALPDGVGVSGFPEPEVLDAWESNQRIAMATCERLWMFWCDVEVEHASECP
ncbi:MAG: hypothetical protein K1X67_14865 [Fimbriimonadaceae bacterium]|nr:hypothetical protein [Fimbriimonadaceae bacterium]